VRELAALPACELRELIRRRELSPVEVTEHFLSRIEEHDTELGTFATLDIRGAREQAKRVEREQLNGDPGGLMHGIPISVKENIPVAGLPTTGLGGRGGDVARDDWIGIERLRRAGAVVLGTNTMYPPGSTNRRARNPWDPSRVPGASSSGSGAAAAASLVPIAIAGDGAGSTRLPAAFCGAVGLHPSRGRVPHVDYVTPSLAFGFTIGPIARDVRDVAMAFQAMAGPDGRDVACLDDDPADCLASIEDGVEALRFAWTDDFGYGARYAFDESSRVIAAVHEAAVGYRRLGATVSSTDARWEDPAPFVAATFDTLGLGWPGLTYSSTPPSGGYRSALEARARTVDRLRDVLRDHDLLLSPTVQAVAPTADLWAESWDNKDMSSGAPTAQNYLCFTVMFNWVGWPALSVPCGLVDGLPVGLQIIGPPGSDALILRAARALQAEHPASVLQSP
jgi:Asp-tRNA(Asn)/Glu-tRNA(Gln) amidotransferase A subunit family amidase